VSLSDEDKKVLEFMEKHYPQYKDNLALGRLLYSKYVGRVAKSIEGDYMKVKIKDLDPEMVGTNVEIRGLIGNIEEYVFKACPICRRKECRCAKPVPEDQLIDLKRIRLIVGDESDIIDVLYFVEGKQDHGLEVGKEVVVRGRLKYFYDNRATNRLEILANKIELVEQNDGVSGGGEAIVIEFIRKAKKVHIDVVKKLCERHGADPEFVFKYFEVRDDYVFA
jgi:OB-fold nucleic acid binding domain.